MICEQIAGRLHDFTVADRTIEYVEIEWHEAFKKIHKKTTDAGRELGIRLDDTVLSRGLYEGDVLYIDEHLIIVVHTPACDTLEITIPHDHAHMVAKVCYEIGNRHAPLFYGNNSLSFITPYNEPMLLLLSKLHGVQVERKVQVLDFEHRVSAAVHNHQH